MAIIANESAPEQGFFTVDGFRLEYTLWPGLHRTLVAIHGFGGTSRSFRRLATELQSFGYGVLSIGLPWHGESTTIGDDTLRLSSFAPALIAMLKSLGIPRAPLLAHSFGGRIAVAMAVLDTSFVSRLFLLAPGGFYPIEDYMFAVLKSQPGQFLMSYPPISGFISSLMIPNLEGDARNKAGLALQKMGASYPEISLRKTGLLGRCYNVTIPVHLLWGKKDKLVPVSYAQEVAQWFRHSDVTTFSHAGHLLMAEQPKQVAAAISEQLSAL